MNGSPNASFHPQLTFTMPAGIRNGVFGGYGVSGVGRELGVESLDPYLETKAVWINGS